MRHVVILLGDKPGTPPRQAWVIEGDEETAKRFADRVTREVDSAIYLVASDPVAELLGYVDMFDTAIRDGMF